MNEDIEQNIRNWYKLFALVNFLVYTFFVFLFSRCVFSFDSIGAVITDIKCVAFLLLSIFTFLVGLFVSLIGMEHAHRVGKKGRLFSVFIIAQILVAVLFFFF